MDEILDEVMNEILKYKMPENTFSESQSQALSALETLNTENSRIVTFDKTSAHNDAEICGITVSDGNGKVLLDTAVKPTQKIDPEWADKYNLDIKEIEKAKSFNEIAPELQKTLAGAEALLFNSNEDYKLFNREVNQLKRDKESIQQELKKAVKRNGYSCKKCLAAIAREFTTYRSPVIVRFIRGLQAGFSNRKTAQEEIKNLKKIAKKHIEELRKQEKQKDKERKELKKKMKEAKAEAKNLKHTLSTGEKIWRPMSRFSDEYAALSLREKKIEKQLNLMFPQNNPLIGSKLSDKEPATNYEVDAVREHLRKNYNKGKSAQSTFSPDITKTRSRKIAR